MELNAISETRIYIHKNTPEASLKAVHGVTDQILSCYLNVLCYTEAISAPH